MNDDYGILKYHFFLRFDSGKLNRPRAVFCSLVVELTLSEVQAPGPLVIPSRIRLTEPG